MEQVFWRRPPCELGYAQLKELPTDQDRLLKEAPLSPVPLASDTLSNVGKNPVKHVTWFLLLLNPQS
jgi:hypothetical protein